MPTSLISWTHIVLPILGAIFWLYAPGLFIGRSWRVRGLLLWGISPLISVAFFAISAILFPYFSIPWNPLWVALAGALISLLGSLRPSVWRQVLPSRQALLSTRSILLVGAIIASAVLIAARLIGAFGIPGAFSQTFDGVFHVNVVQWITQKNDASSLHMSIVPGGPSFYPAAFHAIASLVTLTFGTPIPVSVNSVVIVIASCVWPGSVAALVSSLRPTSSKEIYLSLLFATLFPQFPFLFISYGVLYPNLLAYSLIPAAFAVSVTLLFDRFGPHNWETILILLASLAALALSQPNALFLFIIAVAPLLVYWAWSILPRALFKKGPAWARFVAAAIATSLIVVSYLILEKITSNPGTQLGKMRATQTAWEPQGDKWEALWRVLTFGVGININVPALSWGGLLLALATVIGALVCLWRPRYRFLPFSYSTLGFLAVTAYALDFPRRASILGLWYSDSQRLYAALPLLAVPIAAIGLTAVTQWTTATLLSSSHRSTRNIIVFLAIGVFVIVLTFSDEMNQASLSLRERYRIPQTDSDQHYLLSLDEYQLLSRISNHVAPDEAIMGDPWDGSSFVWAVSGRKAVFPQPALTYPPNSDQTLVANNLRNVASDPTICPALNRLNAYHVLDFGEDFILWDGFVNGENEFFRGFEHLDTAPGITLVDKQGNARLYEVTECTHK